MKTDKNLKAAVLSAGKGTRLKSSLPKVLHKIFGKTLLERVLDSVNKTTISEIFVIVGHKSEDVSGFLKENYTSAVPVKTVKQEPQLGTGDAVFKLYDELKRFDGNLLILCGDTPLIKGETLDGFIKEHLRSGADLSLMSAFMENPFGYGRILRNQSGEISRIIEEKDADNEQKTIKEVNAGVYCVKWKKISPAFFDIKTDNSQGEYYLTDIVEWCGKKKLKMNAFTLKDSSEVFGINSREDLAKAAEIMNIAKINSLMQNGITVIAPDSTWISPETQIGADTVIYPNCYFEGENAFGENCILGPDLFVGGNVRAEDNVKIFQSRVSDAVIGENSTVGPFAHIRNNVELSSSVRVGNFVELKNSKVEEKTNISHLSYVGDSSLGKNVNIGAGTITANYDPITKIKSKTVIEDGVKIGSNSVLVAPVKISKDANVAAGSVITKDVPEASLAIARGRQQIIEKWLDKKLGRELEQK